MNNNKKGISYLGAWFIGALIFMLIAIPITLILKPTTQPIQVNEEPIVQEQIVQLDKEILEEPTKKLVPNNSAIELTQYQIYFNKTVIPNQVTYYFGKQKWTVNPIYAVIVYDQAMKEGQFKYNTAILNIERQEASLTCDPTQGKIYKKICEDSTVINADFFKFHESTIYEWKAKADSLDLEFVNSATYHGRASSEWQGVDDKGYSYVFIFDDLFGLPVVVTETAVVGNGVVFPVIYRFNEIMVG